MPKISFIIPVYNEEKSVSDTIERLFEVRQSLIGKFVFEIVVINDGSTDRTGEIISGIKEIVTVTNPYNIGYGASIKRGIRRATGEWIFITDADGTYPIEQVPELLGHVGPYDMVIGKRVAKDDGTSWLRRSSKRFLNILASRLARFPIEDVNSGMRVFRKDLATEFWNLYPSGFSFTTTITIAFIRSNYPIKYVPIAYGKRTGPSNIVPVDFARFVGIILRIIFYFHPWRILGPFAFVLALIGVVKGSFDFVMHDFVGNLSIFILMFALIIALLALLADILFKQRHF